MADDNLNAAVSPAPPPLPSSEDALYHDEPEGEDELAIPTQAELGS